MDIIVTTAICGRAWLLAVMKGGNQLNNYIVFTIG